MNKSPYIIAEIGSNHCGDRNIGIKHIEYAAKSGVNAVKFQLLNIRKQYSNPSQDIKKIHNVADISINDLRIFKKTADINNVDFMCSGTFLEAVEIIEALNPSFHKIASAQVPHFPQYIEKIKQTGRKTIASTGIASLEELDRLVQIFGGLGNDQLTLLHCRSIYPLETELAELYSIKHLSKRYKINVGYSDHSSEISNALVAIGLGASIFEKHFKINDDIKSPDSESSINFEQMKNYVNSINIGCKSIGDKFNYRKLSEYEKNLKSGWEVNIIAKKEIKKGDLLNKDNIDYIRVGKGIKASQIFNKLEQKGLKAKKDIAKEESLLYEDIDITI